MSEFGENLSVLAQSAHELCLDHPADGEVHAPLYLDCSAIFSDASFKLLKAVARTVVSDVVPAESEGKGAAAVMFIPRGSQGYQWTDKETRIVRITSSNNEIGMDNYSWELLGVSVWRRIFPTSSRCTTTVRAPLLVRCVLRPTQAVPLLILTKE